MRWLLFLSWLLAAGTVYAQAPADPQQAPREVPAAIADENILNLDLSTGGRVVILMNPAIAPNHVERVRTLADQGFYDGVVFHRVIPGFMAQTGDPTGTGQGGSELPDLQAEFTRTPHLRGTVSMARATDENSANSQFFIVFMPTMTLDGNYTAFGRVFSGMEYVDSIAPGEPPASPDRIIQARTGRNVPPASPAMIAAVQQREIDAQADGALNRADGSEKSLDELLHETVPTDGAAPTQAAPAAGSAPAEPEVAEPETDSAADPD